MQSEQLMQSEQPPQEQPQVIQQVLPTTEPSMDNNYDNEPQPPQQPEFNENMNNIVQQPYFNNNNAANPENIAMAQDNIDSMGAIDNIDNIPNPEMPAIDDVQSPQEMQNIQQEMPQETQQEMRQEMQQEMRQEIQPEMQQEMHQEMQHELLPMPQESQPMPQESVPMQHESVPMQQEEKVQVIEREMQPAINENIIPQQEPEQAPQPNLPPDIPEDSPHENEQKNVQHQPAQQEQQQATHENERMMVDNQQQPQSQPQPQSHAPQQPQRHIPEQAVYDNKMMLDEREEIVVEQQGNIFQTQPPPQPQPQPQQLPEPMETDDIEPPQQPTQQRYVPHHLTPTNNNSNNQNANENPNNMIPELVQCKNLLNEFMKRPETEPFNEPVDWKGLNLPNYPLIITRPMDLGSILHKLEVHKYKTADQFATDVRLVFKNAKTYNQVASGIYVVAENLLKQFERRFARIRKNNGNKKRKYAEKISNGQESSYKQRKEFTTLIQSLTPNELGGIVELIDKKSPMALNDSPGDGNDELEIEVYHIDGPTLTDLILHIEKTIAKRGKRKKKAYDAGY